MIGLFIGAVEGLVSRNWGRAFVTAMIGLGIGFGASLGLIFVAGIIYVFSIVLALRIASPSDLEHPGVLFYTIVTIGRAVAWAPMGTVAGLGPAIAMRSRKLAFNGLIGGVLGAFLGGLFFDPLHLLFQGDEAWISRGVGFVLIGIGAGAMIGLVENLAKTAWLHVQAGSLSGKQFVIYKNPTVIGSSPKCEIYLFKDEAIEPKHAAIHTYGTRYEIEDLDTPSGTFVNGRKITRQPLKNGERVYIGETVLDFSEKEGE
jgi:MFS family permease